MPSFSKTAFNFDLGTKVSMTVNAMVRGVAKKLETVAQRALTISSIVVGFSHSWRPSAIVWTREEGVSSGVMRLKSTADKNTVSKATASFARSCGKSLYLM